MRFVAGGFARTSFFDVCDKRGCLVTVFIVYVVIAAPG